MRCPPSLPLAVLLVACAPRPGIIVPPSNPLDFACEGEWVDADPADDVPTSFTFDLTPQADFSPSLLDDSVSVSLDPGDAVWREWRVDSAPCAFPNTTWASWEDVDVAVAPDLTGRGTLQVFVGVDGSQTASRVDYDGKIDRATVNTDIEQRATDEGVGTGWYELDVGLQVWSHPDFGCDLNTCFYGLAAREDHAVTSIDFGSAAMAE